jgi:L-asparaginase
VKIHILTTGGTIEKVYSEQSGTVQNVFAQSVLAKIDQYVEQLRLPDTQIDVSPLLNKDSLEMTDRGSRANP